MSLSRQDIEHIAHLARLELSEADIPAHLAKLDKVIDFITALEQADTADLLPMAHSLAMQQRLRADAVTEADQRDDYQRNAAVTHDGLYIVPRVVE